MKVKIRSLSLYLSIYLSLSFSLQGLETSETSLLAICFMGDFHPPGKKIG